jgi:NACalpha-BTF3-like transcription factor
MFLSKLWSLLHDEADRDSSSSALASSEAAATANSELETKTKAEHAFIVEDKDVDLLIRVSAETLQLDVSRTQAIKALRDNDGDIVNAILSIE